MRACPMIIGGRGNPATSGRYSTAAHAGLDVVPVHPNVVAPGVPVADVAEPVSSWRASELSVKFSFVVVLASAVNVEFASLPPARKTREFVFVVVIDPSRVVVETAVPPFQAVSAVPVSTKTVRFFPLVNVPVVKVTVIAADEVINRDAI